jgi:hypothetical protein
MMLQANRLAPTRLKLAVQLVRARAAKHSAEEGVFEDPETLKKLRIEYDVNLAKEATIFKNWYWNLTRKRRTRVVSFYDPTKLDDIQKEMLKNLFFQHLKQHAKTFRVLFETLYKTGASNPLYGLLKECYRVHKVRITRRMSDEVKRGWEMFLETTPRDYVINSLKVDDVSFGELTTRIQLIEGSNLFSSLAITYFKEGKERAIERDQALLEKLYKTKSNPVFRAQLVELFIRYANLKKYPEFVEKIYFDIQHYKTKPTLWTNIGQAEKEKFHRHIIKRRLLEFFGKLNQHSERYKYWNKFFHKLDDVILPDKNQTILMYFRDLVILETLEIGAVFIYSNEVFDKHLQKHVDHAIRTKRNNSDDYELENLSRTRLMDKTLVLQVKWRDGRIVHRPNSWQDKVDAYLKDFGWEVRRHVLEEEARKLNFIDDSDD